MENHTPHSHIQQLPNHPTTKTETANTIQNNNTTPNQEHRKQYKMGYLYLLLTTHTKNHKLLIHTNVKISYKCSNTVAQLTKPASGHNIPPHNKNGVCCLTCKTCNLLYIGQTSQNLKMLFQEHIRYVKINSPQSACDQHILNNQHEYGTLAESMILLKALQHESVLLPFEQFHIQAN